jgi:hypothetical protein
MYTNVHTPQRCLAYTPVRRSPVTATQLWGYGLAFVGVCVYNYRKVQAQVKEKKEASRDEKTSGLLGEGNRR